MDMQYHSFSLGYKLSQKAQPDQASKTPVDRRSSTPKLAVVLSVTKIENIIAEGIRHELR